MMSTEKTEIQIQLENKLAELKGKTPTDADRAEVKKLVEARKLEIESQLPESGESRGFGDTIKKVTNKLGIKQCGACKKRQMRLNKLFPYK
jgi:hypothetical protein